MSYNFGQAQIDIVTKQAERYGKATVYVVKVHGKIVKVRNRAAWSTKSSASGAFTRLLGSGLSYTLSQSLGITLVPGEWKHIIKEYKKYLFDNKIVEIVEIT